MVYGLSDLIVRHPVITKKRKKTLDSNLKKIRKITDANDETWLS